MTRLKLQGSGTTVISVGDDFVGGDYKVSGNITGGGVKTRVNFSIKFKGNGNVSGVETTCNINAKYNLAIDPAGLAMVGTTSGNASFSHLGSGNLKGPFSQPLPHGADGRWIVMLDVAPLQKIAGTGTIFVDNYLGTNTAGRILSTKLSGSVSKRPLMAKTKMSGSGDSGGTQLNMNFTSNVIATNQIASIKGKILGQKVQN
ncbi:MAG: hypothetical protein NT154_37255 [Verrucomicrobia bacterium]|nr:hypothetical protein [Verrucomicrobiota bacterium]